MSTFPPVNLDGSPFHAGLPDNVTLSAAIYEAYLDPRVLALLQMSAGTDAQKAARFTTAELLHAAGIAVDMELVMWNWDPSTTNYLRKTSGLDWVYDAFGPAGGGQNPPPVGVMTLPVSVDATAYPPFLKPQPSPTQSSNLVGVQISGNLYATGPAVVTSPASACNITDLQQVEQPASSGITYTAHVGSNPMGISAYFTKNS